MEKGMMGWNNLKLPVVKNTVETKDKSLSVVEYKKLIKSEPLVFVDFFAPWCGPCRSMIPTIDKMKKKYKGKIKIIKINVDKNKSIARELKINSIPYLVLYKNGKLVYSKKSAIGEKAMEKIFQKHL